MRQSEEVQAHLRQLSIICFAIFSGVVIFTAVVWYLLASGGFPPEDLDFPSWMGSMFNVVALVALVGAMLTGQLVGAIIVVGSAIISMVPAWPRVEQMQL